ncbi:MAG: aminoglycoside resistance protein, partial [Actinobacteria bacterium]|nr:aminoglycoside resistance protein [Actinomycetota bacterium]
MALRRWGGRGAVHLLAADPRVRALLLERLGPDD